MTLRTGVAVSSTKAAHRVFSQCTRYAIHRPLATRNPTASTTKATSPAATEDARLAATSSVLPRKFQDPAMTGQSRMTTFDAVLNELSDNVLSI